MSKRGTQTLGMMRWSVKGYLCCWQGLIGMLVLLIGVSWASEPQVWPRALWLQTLAQQAPQAACALPWVSSCLGLDTERCAQRLRPVARYCAVKLYAHWPPTLATSSTHLRQRHQQFQHCVLDHLGHIHDPLTVNMCRYREPQHE